MASIKKFSPLFIVLMAILLACIWMRMEEQAAHVTQSHLEAQINQLNSQQATLEARINHLQTQIGDSAQTWVLSEVHYYLNIAYLRLSVFNDVKTALQLMQWGQQRLIAAHAPVGLQEALLTDITDVAAVKIPDIKAMTQTLSEIKLQLPTLALQRRLPTPEEHLTNRSSTASVAHWQQMLKNAWLEIKNLVRIQPRNAQMDYALFDETILRQTVEVELQRASIAAVIGQKNLYYANIQQAIALLQQFFAPGVELEQILASLQALAVQPILPEIPQANRALIWLQLQAGQGQV